MLSWQPVRFMRRIPDCTSIRERSFHLPLVEVNNDHSLSVLFLLVIFHKTMHEHLIQKQLMNAFLSAGYMLFTAARL